MAALHLAAVVLLAIGTAGGGQPLALGLLLTAYLAGVKHSYDWDHLAAIDNSTRKFVAQHQDPVSVGFAFSLGHSSVVVLAGVLVVAGATMAGHLMEDGSAGNLVLGVIGSGVSGLFLLMMGLFNGSAFIRAAGAYRRARMGGRIDAADLEAKGFMALLLAKPLARVRRPRNIYVIGFLFGLGFDTATTIGLLVLTTAASLSGVSAPTLIALPLAFTAAMTLCDSLNGVAMMRMYRSALEDPLRRLGFNAAVTGISALSALFIATMTLGGLLNTAFRLEDPVTSWLGSVDLGDAGLLLVALLLMCWAASAVRRCPVRNAESLDAPSGGATTAGAGQASNQATVVGQVNAGRSTQRGQVGGNAPFTGHHLNPRQRDIGPVPRWHKGR
ncbi:high-affinity nickel-transport protein [Neomicrococcus aestuarii]|uniref:Nickel/cobalt efflux system n=1 Tax=Neomicrococcus aestuarii TaxID=556325 RepID=A0A7W8TW77_9MICC|nr:high-affinity nickel-transport protein [Neomicrococcus aestuarii]